MSRPDLSAAIFIGFCTTLPGCAGPGTPIPTASHITAPARTAADADIPAPVAYSLVLPPPRAGAQVETYSVTVDNIPAQELLLALARDAKLNVDVHPGIEGSVTLNAVDQSLPQLLARIARQVDMRWELHGGSLAVMPDTPFLRNYRIDYVNIERETSGSVTVATQIATSPNVAGPTASANGGSNNSLTRVENKTAHRFWATLEKNLRDLLHETDKLLPEGSSETLIERSGQPVAAPATARSGSPEAARSGTAAATEGATLVRRATFREAASVIVNPEGGVITVRATSRQHEKVQEFIDAVMTAARRQVLIEATIAEVRLSSAYQQGISWSALALGRAGFTVRQGPAGSLSAPTASFLELSYANAESRFGNIAGTIKLLESFGTVKVLSSPKLAVLNNQTAMLKVVDNSVYFTIKADTTTNQTTSTTTYTTTLQSVPVGLVMNVTPQVGEQDTVLLNLRPSISRIVDYVDDPNPALKTAGIVSQVPVIRTREMESVLRICNGNIAIMGGLMEDEQNDHSDGIPGLARLPGIGNLFRQRDEARTKTELVVFLRPVVLREGQDVPTAPSGELP